MKPLKKSEKVLLGVLCVLLIALILTKLRISIFPYRSEAKSLEHKVENTQKRLRYAKKVENNIGEKISNLDSLKKQLDKAAKKVPTEARTPEIGYDIKKLAKKFDLELNDISFGEENTTSKDDVNEVSNQIKDVADKINETTKDNSETKVQDESETISKVPVSFNILGDYGEILDFVKALEEQDRLCKVRGIALSNDKKYNISMTVDFFFSELDYDSEKASYEFNEGDYGKENMFK